MIVEDLMEELKEVLGECSQDKMFSRLTNAITILAKKGRFDLLTGYVDICAHSDGKTICLPREIETPLAVNINGGPVYFRNKWFEFHMNGPGSNCAESPWTWDDRGYFPTFMDIMRPARVVAVADLKTDLVAQIRMMGLDQNGKTIRTQEPDGEWLDGFQVPINISGDFPFGIPVPPDSRRFVRNFKTVDMTELVSASAHQIATGAPVTITVLAGSLPPPLLLNITYFARKTSLTTISLHADRAAALTGDNPIVMTLVNPATVLQIQDQRQVLVQTEFLSAIPHRIATGRSIKLEGTPVSSPFIQDQEYFARVRDTTHFTVHLTEDDAFDNLNPIDATDTGTNVIMLADQTILASTWLDFSVNHNIKQGDAVTISNETGAPPSPLINGNVYYARFINVTRLTLHNTLADATNGKNPIAFTDGGTGNTAVVKRLAANAAIGAVNNILCPAHGLSLAGGDQVRFECTGLFPNPVTANTVYRAEPPNSIDSFTLNDLTPTPINITVLGTGQLTLVISRVFTIGFDSSWQTDATGLSNGDPIKVRTEGSFPGTVPGLSSLTTYYLRKLADNQIEIYDSAFNAQNAPSTVGRVTVTSIQVGDMFLVFERSVTPVPASSLLRVDPNTDIEDGAVAQFETTGSLPANLMILTDYKLSLENGFLRVKDMADVNVPIVGIGSGAHTMNIRRQFAIQIPTSIEIVSNNYDNGAAVTLETTDTLPTPLLALTTYYIRRIDDDHVELYDTKARARDTTATTGRIIALNVGTGQQTAVQLLLPFYVSRVDRVSKSITQGFIKLYAWDPGREESITLIGDYFPNETEPEYRRIKVRDCCAWIRMRYQRRLYKITSTKDWIPLKSKMALIMAVKAIDLYFKEFSDRGEALEAIAEKWAQEEQASSDGPDQVQIQINADIFTNPDEQSMDTNDGFYG